MNLNMYEDALEYCDKALSIDENHTISSYRKAKSLAFLFRFDESIQILKDKKLDKHIEYIN